MRIEVRIPSEVVANAMVAVADVSGAKWLREIRLVAPYSTTEKPFYSDPRLYENPFTIEVVGEDPGREVVGLAGCPRADGGGVRRTLREYDFRRGLETFARKHPGAFGEFLGGGDGPNSDMFFQCVVFGEVVFQ